MRSLAYAAEHEIDAYLVRLDDNLRMALREKDSTHSCRYCARETADTEGEICFECMECIGGDSGIGTYWLFGTVPV